VEAGLLKIITSVEVQLMKLLTAGAALAASQCLHN